MSTRRRSSWPPIPSRFDVMVTTNLFGDIITDITAIGHRQHGFGGQRQHQARPHGPQLCSNRCTGRRPTSPARGVADPTAAILSVSLLLDHLGLPEEAARIEKAVITDLAGRTPGRAAVDRPDRRRDRRERVAAGPGVRRVAARPVSDQGRLRRPSAPAWTRIAGTTECSLRARRRGRGPGLGGWRSAATVHTSGYISYMSRNTRTPDYFAPEYLTRDSISWTVGPGYRVVGRLLR